MHDILLYVIALLFGTAIFALLGILGLLTKYDANNDTRKNVDGSRKSKVRLSNASHRVRSSNAGKRTNHEHEKAENVECYTELKEQKQAGIDILHLLNYSKLLPVDLVRGWQLVDVIQGLRIWAKHLHKYKATDINLPLLSSCTKVKGSSQSILNTMREHDKCMEWHAGITSIDTLLRPSEIKCEDESIQSEGFPIITLQYDVVSFTMNTVQKSSCFRKVMNIFSNQASTFSTVTEHHIHRYSHREDNGCTWMLEVEDNPVNWCFHAAQPVEEIDHSLLTIIQSSSSRNVEYTAEILAKRMAGLRHYFLHRKVQCTPFATLTLPFSKSENSYQPLQSSKTAPQRNIIEDFERSVSEDMPGKTEPSLLRKFRNLIEQRRDVYDNDKERNKKNFSEQKVELAASILQHDSINNNVPHARRVPLKHSQSLIERKATSDILETERDEKVARRRLNLSELKQVRSLDNDDPLRSKSPSIASNGTSNDGDELNSCSSDDESHFDINSLGDAETEKLERSYRHVASHTASQLMEEVTINYHHLGTKGLYVLSSTDNPLFPRFCGVEKDVVTLKKISEDSSELCYLGKGLLPVAPEVVFNALKNPRTRFTYDDMLKKIEILHDFGNGMKIVYMYHEVSQLFKKESRDFCVLQSEKVDGDKYIISLCSVGWPTSASSGEGTIRGQFLASGWVVEPVMKHKRPYSMVTYISKMELAVSKSPNGNMIEDLASRQPQCLAYLRQYLVPHKPLSRSMSTGAVDVSRLKAINRGNTGIMSGTIGEGDSSDES